MMLDHKDFRRFMENVCPEPNSGCWLWDGHTKFGYGQFRVEGKYRGAHRVSFEHHVAQIPENLTIDHRCRVKCCVNPAHLQPVSRRENSWRYWHGPQSVGLTPEMTVDQYTEKRAAIFAKFRGEIASVEAEKRALSHQIRAADLRIKTLERNREREIEELFERRAGAKIKETK